MNFSSVSDRTLLGRALRLPLRLVPADLVVPVLQGPARGCRWIVGASTHGCWLGSYEHGKQRAFAAQLTPGSAVYDVGANVGFYTLLAARAVGPRGAVVAFEPLPENLAFLRRHLELNGASQVRIVEAAVSDRGGTARFARGASREMGSLREGGELEVKTLSLDAFVGEGSGPPPDCIKLDVEGGECAALEGARRVLERWRPVVFLATHGPELHARCCELLRQARYALASLDGRSVESTDELLATPLD